MATFEMSNGTTVPHASGHYDLLAKLRTFLEATLPLVERWIIQRTVTSGTDYEAIWKAPGAGFSAEDEFYCGIKTYQSIPADYYNFKVNGFTGYVSSNTFETQPGRATNDLGIPLYNNTIPYIFRADGNSCFVMANIEGNYMTFFLGKIYPYAMPHQWPYPMLIGGMLTTASATRYDAAATSWWKGARANCLMKFIDGNWRQPQVLPFAGTNTLRNTGSSSNSTSGYYPPIPLILSENITGYVNNYGEIPGIYYISGYNNAVENTLTIDTIDYFIIRDKVATGLKDYIALKLG